MAEQEDSKPFLERFLKEEGYHTQDENYYGRVEQTFRSSIPHIKDGGLILDWGCAKGHTTLELANLCPRSTVIGIDIWVGNTEDTKKTLEEARKGYVSKFHDILSNNQQVYLGGELKLPSSFILADGFEAPFPDEKFDAVYCMNNLYFVLKKMKKGIANKRFHEVGRLVKSNGYLLISGYDAHQIIEFAILQKKDDGFMLKEVSSTEAKSLKKSLEPILI